MEFFTFAKTELVFVAFRVIWTVPFSRATDGILFCLKNNKKGSNFITEHTDWESKYAFKKRVT